MVGLSDSMLEYSWLAPQLLLMKQGISLLEYGWNEHHVSWELPGALKLCGKVKEQG
jgi:hypothetical protein